jgi:hypothetical protein
MNSNQFDDLALFDKRSPGSWLQAIAIAHAGVGSLLYRRALVKIIEDRTSIPDHGDKTTAFWFMVAAPVLWLGGRLLRSVESADDLAGQRAAGVVLAGTGLAGGVAMPASGFWAVAAVGLASLRRSL